MLATHNLLPGPTLNLVLQIGKINEALYIQLTMQTTYSYSLLRIHCKLFIVASYPTKIDPCAGNARNNAGVNPL